MANVRMDLSELDAMRSKIANLESEVSDYKEHAKEIKVTFAAHRPEIRTRPTYSGDRFGMECSYENVIRPVDKVEYIGFATIIADLRKEEEYKVKDKLDTLDEQLKISKDQLRDLRKLHKEEIDNNNAAHQDECKILETTIKKLRGEKVDLSIIDTLKEQVKQLEKALEVNSINKSNLDAIPNWIKHIYGIKSK